MREAIQAGEFEKFASQWQVEGNEPTS
jgi:hypothetical protein